jgi:histidyl-tRNA synthetase
MSKPSIPQGTRDFSAAEVRKRQYLFDTFRKTFELYGYQPLETPAMENLNTLMGKYGEEGDRLIFKILNNGLHEKKDKDALRQSWETLLERPVSLPAITERALRYDLTIPFARYVATHHQQLPMPFRRYQMQPVWRADRPQRGRYREFWQCDCDVVGSTSLLNEAELIAIYRSVFHQLAIPGISVKINSRKLLLALAEVSGHPEQLIDITVAIDKTDKIGWEGVSKELSEKGISGTAQDLIQRITQLKGDAESVLGELHQLLGEKADAGIAEIRDTLRYHQILQDADWTSNVEIDLSLARGLNYYTGLILEVTTDAVKMGSIGGGGRYDDLTGLFGVKGLSGVGISFGVDRIYDVMDELGLFPEALAGAAQVLVTNFGGADELYALSLLKTLRDSGIAAEMFPEQAKLDKQFKYADKKGIAYVLIAGEQERVNQTFALKNLQTGVQKSDLSSADLLQLFA